MDGGHPIIDIVLPTFRMEPDEPERFYPSKAKQIADRIIADELNGVTYDEEDAKHWSLNISDKIREAVCESLGKSRFKIVVQTTIGKLKDQGIRIASRCLWDPNTDNYASCKYSNTSPLNRRGKCDYTSGICACFAGYTGPTCGVISSLV